MLLANRDFELQNIEQGMPNVEQNISVFCGFLLDIRYSIVNGYEISVRRGAG
jgi:hypothetical protein